jgi:hypothetical protein
MTATELNAMAAPAKMGLSSNPNQQDPTDHGRGNRQQSRFGFALPDPRRPIAIARTITTP